MLCINKKELNEFYIEGTRDYQHLDQHAIAYFKVVGKICNDADRPPDMVKKGIKCHNREKID